MTLTLTLAIDDGKGGLRETGRVRELSELRLTARFENRGKRPLSVVIDAKPISHGRYSVEVQDADGNPVQLHGFGMCGTMSPLMEHEISAVEPGGSFRTPVHPGHGASLPPGRYRVRVRYDAHESDFAEDSRAAIVKERLKHLWAGTLTSDWIPVTIQPA